MINTSELLERILVYFKNELGVMNELSDLAGADSLVTHFENRKIGPEKAVTMCETFIRIAKKAMT